MKKLITVFLVFSFISKVFSQDTLKIAAKPVFLQKKGYKIQIPAGWRISPECLDNNCSLFSPIDTLSSPDPFVDNINITVDKLPSASYGVDQYAKFSIDYLPKVVKEFKLLSKKKLNANAYLIEYQGLKSNYRQSWKQYYYIKNAKVYIVTLATETPKFEYYKTLIDKELKSFKML